MRDLLASLWGVTLGELYEMAKGLSPPPPPLGRRPSWGELVSLEPRLAILARRVADADDGQEIFCAHHRWFGVREWRNNGFKEAMSKLVGWDAGTEDDVLRSSEAYEVVYRFLVDEVLPDCRACTCYELEGT
jgi:hypothetical protein